jgi:hypothetical protein
LTKSFSHEADRASDGGGLKSIKEEIQETLKEEGAGNAELEKKRKRKSKSKIEIEPAILGSVCSVSSLPFDFTFKRLGLTPLSKEEKETLGKSVAAVFNRYMPEIYSQYGELINLTLCVGGIAMLRYFEFSEKHPKAKKETPPSEKYNEDDPPPSDRIARRVPSQDVVKDYPTFNSGLKPQADIK